MTGDLRSQTRRSQGARAFGEDAEVLSHPALVGNRLYVRNLLGVYCFLLD